jgi:superfamily II DNA or RNA helicase
MATTVLFYSQIKREFTHASWRRGQIYFREERVSDVRQDGDLIMAKVQGTDKSAYETALVAARGTIANSKCSCPAHRVYETHCKHVAALSIWVVERGSLLRSGAGGTEYGMAEGDHQLVLADAQRAIADPRLRKLIQAHPELATSGFVVRRDLRAGLILGQDAQNRSFSIPITLVEAAALLEHVKQEEPAVKKSDPVAADPVTYVRGIFLYNTLTGLTAEPALRYIDPISQTIQVSVIANLQKQPEPAVWKTPLDVYLRVLPVPDPLPVVQSLTAPKQVFQGQAALENLAKLLTSRERDRIVFDRAVELKIDPEPLKLTTLSLGGKQGKNRTLSYEFRNATGAAFTSDDLAELSQKGKLSNQYIWKGDQLYKLETSLSRLAQYANRSGVAAPETEDAPLAFDGYGALYDDADHPLHPLAAYRLSLELGAENFRVDPEWEAFHEWWKVFAKKKTPPLPKVGYGFTLREYQTNGLSWLWSLYHRGLSALLADDMGLGKTHQVLAFLTSLYKSKSKPKLPSLVVAPTSVVAAWSQKLTKYKTGLKWHVFHGRGRVLPKRGVDIVLTTYGILQREAALREMDWHVVVLDEAQAIKNASTISARAARMMKCGFRIAMTGTPVENSPMDLWSVMEFLLPGYLGTQARFKRLYGSGRETLTRLQTDSLKRLVSPFLLRRTKAQVLTELPEKTEEVVTCEMTAAQKRAYRLFLSTEDANSMRESLKAGTKIDYSNILALLTRLKQVCDHPRLPEITAGRVKKLKTVDPAESGKWEAFEELLNEALGSNLKVVVFTQYLAMMDLICHHLSENGIGYTDLRGDTPDRAARLEKFADDPECKVFVCSLLAGGLGIDLTAGSVCIHMDRWWNPAKENQATDRLHRIGQTRGVQVFKLQIPGTVEDRIASIIQSKLELSGALIEESPTGLKAFSRKELLELLKLPQ